MRLHLGGRRKQSEFGAGILSLPITFWKIGPNHARVRMVISGRIPVIQPRPPVRRSVMKARILFVLLVVATGCSDEETVAPGPVPSFVAGYVKFENPQKSPIGDGEVILAEIGTTSGWPGGGLPYDTGWYRTVCTQSNGYFSFEFDASQSYGYELRVFYSFNQYVYHVSADVPQGNTKYLTMLIPSGGWEVSPCN
jgi:hypothetical protein